MVNGTISSTLCIDLDPARIVLSGLDFFTHPHLPLSMPTMSLLPTYSYKMGPYRGALSPLHFALAIEPLAIAVRADDMISGITKGGLEQKISL